MDCRRICGRKRRKTLEEVAEGYLNQLVNRSLIQVAETTVDGRVKLCRIHDLLREIIISKSTDQNFITAVGEQNRRWPEKVRRLSVYGTLGNVQQNQNVHQLRSLHMFGTGDQILSNSSVFSLFRLLKVLDLRGSPFDAFPNEITKLYHLRYLSLRNTKVKMLPSSIGKLQNLETLDLKGACVTELPVEILKLLRLRHLLVYRYSLQHSPYFASIQGFKAPPGVGGLLSLQKLNYMEANQGCGNLMGEIGRLINLRRLGIIKLRREDGATLCSSIEKLSNLRSLTITSVEEDDIIDLQHLSSPPQFLQTLYLEGRLEKSPHWITSLHSLVRVVLKRSRLKDDPLEYLGALPNLVELELLQVYDGETFCFKAGGFQRLKVVWLTKFEGLRLVRVEEGSMPNLEKLQICSCMLLERVPLGIEHLTNLNHLELIDMPGEFILRLKKNREGGESWKTTQIPNVLIANFEDVRRIEFYHL